MDMTDLRGLATVLCMIGFFAVVWWAYGPSRKQHFQDAGMAPFDDDDSQDELKEKQELER
jgi:cytochrome c oxidase cbb3-type subunit IV